MSTDGQPAGQAAAPTLEPVDVGGVAVMPNSAEEAAALAAASKGVMLQSDYTKKSQDLAQQREQFRQEREAHNRERGAQPDPIGRPRTGLGPGYGGLSGGRSPGSAVGGERVGAPTYPSGPEYPTAGTPTERAVAPAPDDEDYLTGAQVRRLVAQERAQIAAQVEQGYESIQAEQQELKFEREMERMGTDPRLPGFNKTAVEEAYNLLPYSEQARYNRLPPAEQYRMVFYDHVMDRIAPPATAQTTTPQATEPAVTQPPFQEGASGPNPGLSGPPDLQSAQISRGNAASVMDQVREREG